MPAALDLPDDIETFEMLEYIPSRFKVIRHLRPKLACARSRTNEQ
jgi:hypothetical protein